MDYEFEEIEWDALNFIDENELCHDEEKGICENCGDLNGEYYPDEELKLYGEEVFICLCKHCLSIKNLTF